MELKDPLPQLLLSQAPAGDIMDVFNREYSNISYPGPDYYQQLLACFAIHHNHMSLLRRLLQISRLAERLMREPTSLAIIPTPLIIAAENENLEAIDLLLKYGARSDAKGVGTIVGNKLVGKVITSAMEVACKLDNVTLLKKLRKSYNSYKIPILHLTCNQKAQKCFSHLVKEGGPSLHDVDSNGQDILLLAARQGAFYVSVLAENGVKCRGQKTFDSLETTLHLACKRNMTCIRQDLLQTLQLLVKMGAKAHTFDAMTQLPIDLLIPHIELLVLNTDTTQENPTTIETDVQCCMLFQAFDFLLKSMKSELDESSTGETENTVGYMTFLHLLRQSHAVVKKFKTKMPAGCVTSIHTACQLNNTLTKLFLDYGIDLVGDMKFYGSVIEYVFRVVLPSFVTLYDPTFHKYVFKTVLLLLQYGAKLSNHCYQPLLDLLANDANNVHFVEACVNAMAHQEHQEFLQALAKEKRIDSNSIKHICSQNRGLQRCRALKCMTRLVIYESCPKRRTPKVMLELDKQQRVPPLLLKYILNFDC